MDCQVNITAQDVTYPTYKKIDCDFHVNTNDDNFYGRLIDCTFVVTHLLATACRSLDQSIRLVVIIDGVDVSDALIEGFNIQHNKNKISTCSLNLGDVTYSPRTNSHIDLEKEVIITAYINTREKKLFTGLLDEPAAENTPKFKVIISARDYGKRLLDKKLTLISVQDAALSTKRNDVVKYLAEQAEVTNVDIPEMDPVTIDNSFQHQSIWDMIQKEVMIELYWLRFSEDNVMQLKLDEIKSDPVLYPTPDWSYNEDKFVRLSYKRTRIEFNKIAIMGATAKSRVPTVEDVTSTQLSYRKSWPAGTVQDDILGTDVQGNFTIRTVWAGQMGLVFFYRTRVTWTETDFEFLGHKFTGNNVNLDYYGVIPAEAYFVWAIHRVELWSGEAQAGSILISIQGKKRVTTYETRYDQISARITDPNSIAKYGERDGGSIEYPLIETQEQCAAIGKKIIRNSHKIGIGVFEIPFNPLMTPGETVGLSDRKIGLTRRFLIEGVGHNGTIDDEGKIKVRTAVVGVRYA